MAFRLKQCIHNNNNYIESKTSLFDVINERKGNSQGLFHFDGSEWKISPVDSFTSKSNFDFDVITSLGKKAGREGKENTYVGYRTGEKEINNSNTYVGYKSGLEKSGGMNVHIGSEAGMNDTGSKNVYIGNNVCSNTGSSGDYNVCIGNDSALNLESGIGNVFLGSVSGSNNQNGNWNVFLGQSAGQNNESGTSHIAIGSNAGISIVQGTNSICIGDGSDTSSDNPNNQIVLGHGVVSYGDNTITFPSNLVSYPHGTEVNFSSPSGGCLYPVSSSIRWKTNVQDIDNTIDTSMLYNLRPVTFNSVNDDKQYQHIGLIAEEVDKYFPSLVPKDSLNRPASVKYSILSVLLLEELKKIKQCLNELQKAN